MENKIYSINGPVVTIKGKTDLAMMEMVYVGKSRLVGEVIRMNDKETTIQVYEETSGLGPGAAVETTGAPMSVELGPGMIEGIYDGIQRPLEKIVEKVGACITRGVEVYVRKVAPLGDPVEVTVRGYELSLRKADTEMIEVE